jgi:antitoxin (DNA-binding transcriptional repressor) of toxin-antitoxin stability system
MRFVSVRDLRGKSAQIWKRLAKLREMVITSNGKPIAIISATSEGVLEESLSAIRAARAIASVESMQMRSIETGKDRLSLDDINSEVQAERKARSR